MGQNQVWRQGPRAGAGGGGSVKAPDQWGWGVSPQYALWIDPLSPASLHTFRGSPRRKSAEALSRTFFLGEKKKNSFAVQCPGSKYRINQARWHVPALLVRALTPGALHVTRASGASSCCCCRSPEEEAPARCQTPAPLNRAAAPEAPQTHWGF